MGTRGGWGGQIAERCPCPATAPHLIRGFFLRRECFSEAPTGSVHLVLENMMFINVLERIHARFLVVMAVFRPLFSTRPGHRESEVAAGAPGPAKVARVCRHCGAEFMAPAINRGRPVVFCSEACRRAAAADQMRTWRAAHPPSSRGDHREALCITCGKPFTPPRRQAGRYTGFCSEECRHARKLEHLRRWREARIAPPAHRGQ